MCIRDRLLGKAVREGVKALGLKLLAKEEFASNAVTGVYPPEGVPADDLRRKVKARGVTLAGGQGALKGKIFRIGHIGYILDTDIIVTLSIIGETLREMGYNVDPTLGVRKAMEVFNEGTNS